jgi:hypothetical protein
MRKMIEIRKVGADCPGRHASFVVSQNGSQPVTERKQGLKEELMNTSATNSQYILLFRGNEWQKGLSQEEMQSVSTRWMAWFNGLLQEGKALAGSPLHPEGKIVSGKNGRTVVDGPFAESKEAVGGYFLLQVNNLDEAIAIARQCPGLPYGAQIEVRPVAEQCPLTAEALTQQELAQAGAGAERTATM